MWPFRKSKPMPLVLKRSQPSSDAADLRKIDEETICPACLARYPADTFYEAFPLCSDCGSEAMDVSVKPFSTYLAGMTVSNFDQMLKRLESADFLPQFKSVLRQRMLDLRALRAKLDD